MVLLTSMSGPAPDDVMPTAPVTLPVTSKILSRIIVSFDNRTKSTCLLEELSLSNYACTFCTIALFDRIPFITVCDPVVVPVSTKLTSWINVSSFVATS